MKRAIFEFFDRLHTAWAVLTARSYLVITNRWNTARFGQDELDYIADQVDVAQQHLERFRQDVRLHQMKQEREEQGRE